jgi:hypothetical protein
MLPTDHAAAVFAAAMEHGHARATGDRLRADAIADALHAAVYLGRWADLSLSSLCDRMGVMTDDHLRESRRAAGVLAMAIGGALLVAAVAIVARAVAAAPGIEHAAGGALVALVSASFGLAVGVPGLRKWRANR